MASPDWKTIIRRVRTNSGMSQSAVARAVGVTQPYVCQLENGDRTDPPYSVGVALLALSEQWITATGAKI